MTDQPLWEQLRDQTVQGLKNWKYEPVPTDEELLQVAASVISPYESYGIGIGEYEEEAECAIEVYGSELIAYAREVIARWGQA